ncbi:hypothetical protein ACX80N_12445 [Arthrobacter sp. MDT2-16]
MSYRTISTRKDAAELADLLVSPSRYSPVVVISPNYSGTLVDPERLAECLGSEADVYVLASTSVAFDFDDVMPTDTSVYGGAIRSYPTGRQWTTSPWKAPFRHAFSEAEDRGLIDLVAADVATMAVPAAAPVKRTSVISTPSPAPKLARTGTVAMLMAPDGALVKLTGGVMARIDTSSIAPGISSNRLLQPGLTVEGVIDDNVMDISAMSHTPAEAIDHMVAGSTYPALVLTEKKAALFPGLDVKFPSAHAADTVVAVTVEQVGRCDGKEWRIVEAAAGTEVSDPLPFIQGAAPWLEITVLPADVLEEAEGEDATLNETPAPAVDFTGAMRIIHDTLTSLQDEKDRLAAQLDDERSKAPATPVPAPSPGGAELDRVRNQLALVERARINALEAAHRANRDLDTQSSDMTRLTRENERLREEIRLERDRATRTRQLSRAIETANDGPLFSDLADQFRHDVYLEWVRRIPAASKGSLPLPEYGFQDGFIEGVESIRGVDRSKIVAVAVEVLTGIAESMPGREMHRLRDGAKGGAPVWESSEFGTAWRVSLQVNAASARRLHFWRGNGGKVTFATVGVHDDMGI